MQKKSLSIQVGIQISRLAIFAFLAGGGMSAFAQVTNYIALTNSDVLGTSSFDAAGNWSSGVAPVSGLPADFNAYATTNFVLRTPSGGASYIFAGDSLSIDPFSTNITATATNIGTGTLSFKGYGLITVGNLILNGGTVANNATGGNPDTAQLAGNVNVNATSTLDGGNTNLQTLNVQAPMGGPAGINVLDYGTVVFSASNSYVGQTTVGNGSGIGGYLKVNNANAIPLSVTSGDGIGNLRVNFETNIPSGSTFDLNGNNVTVGELISGATNFSPFVPANIEYPEIINSAVGTTNTLTIGYDYPTGTGYTYRGIIADNTGTGGGLALTVTGVPVFGQPGLASLNSTFLCYCPPGDMTYSGDTTINGGVLSLRVSGNQLPWGPGKGNVIVNSGGLLDLQGHSPQINGLFGNGLVDDLVTGRSTLNCGSNNVSSVFSGIIQNSAYAGVAGNSIIQINKYGAGTLTLSGTNTYYGNVSVNAGILQITCQFGDGVTGGGLGVDGQNASTTGAKEVTVKGGAGLYLNATNGSPIVVDNNTLFITAGVIANEAGSNTINGQIWLTSGGGATNRVDAGTLVLNGNLSITNQTTRSLALGGAGNGVINGVIADYNGIQLSTSNLSLNVFGPGTWTLSANNIYSGGTTISGGTLALSGSGSITKSPLITIAGGTTFDVSADSPAFALASGQTLSNNTSTATINGNATASSGTLALTYSSGTPSLSVANGSFTLAAGTPVTINNTGAALSAGTYTIISKGTGGSVAGGAPTSVTVTGGGLAVGAAASLQITSGQLNLVVTGGAPPSSPHITGITLSGTSLVITGTNAPSGNQYNILTTTNLLLPLSQWMVLPTNTFSSGNFNITNTVTPGAPQNYYLIRVP